MKLNQKDNRGHTQKDIEGCGTGPITSGEPWVGWVWFWLSQAIPIACEKREPWLFYLGSFCFVLLSFAFNEAQISSKIYILRLGITRHVQDDGSFRYPIEEAGGRTYSDVNGQVSRPRPNSLRVREGESEMLAIFTWMPLNKLNVSYRQESVYANLPWWEQRIAFCELLNKKPSSNKLEITWYTHCIENSNVGDNRDSMRVKRLVAVWPHVRALCKIKSGRC